jgi:hypothetical protein
MTTTVSEEFWVTVLDQNFKIVAERKFDSWEAGYEFSIPYIDDRQYIVNQHTNPSAWEETGEVDWRDIRNEKYWHEANSEYYASEDSDS